MAFGVKYKSYFMHVDGLVKEIRLSKEGYTGDVTEWYTKSIGFEKLVADSDLMFGEPIAATTINLGFVFTELYDLREFATTRRTFKCEVVTVVSNQIEFSGWIEPWNASHPYQTPNYEVSMTASCGLAQLAKKKFALLDGDLDGIKTGYEVIKICLDLTGLELPIRTSVHTYLPGTAGQDPYRTYTINAQQRYIQGATRLTCYEVLQTELNKFNAVLVQWDNRWVIVSKVDHALGTHTSYYEYSYSNVPSFSASWSLIHVTNANVSKSLKGGQIRIEPPINKYRVEADLMPKISIFSNGDMQNWDSSGLIGWGFSHMPQGASGWNKFSTGDEDYPFALKVIGQGPPVLVTYKKHWWSKKKIKSVEPPEYIEGPVGVYVPSVKNVNLNFQYYTGRNAFFIAIRLSSSVNPSKVRWVQFDGTLKSDWDPILIEKHLQATTGSQKNVKGQFSLDIPLEYYNTIPRPGADGATPYQPYDTIQIRFYKSYPEDGFSGIVFYTIFNLEAKTESIYDTDETLGTFSTTIGHDTITEDEANTISLLTGDYTEGFSGTTLNASTGLPTGYWFRRGNSEQLSIYKAMMIDRLCMTWKPLRVFEGAIKILPDQPTLTYLHTLQFVDMDNARFMIVRYSYEEHRRIANVTAIEIDYEEPADIEQETYIGRKRIGNEDASYPSADGDGGGRLGIDQEPLTNEEIEDALDDANARIAVLFEDVPSLKYTVGAKSTDSVDLSDYLSATYVESEADLDDEFKHDLADFSLSVTSKPTWISKVVVDGLIVTAEGKPTVEGNEYIFIDVYDAPSETTLPIKIPVEAIAKTVLTVNLLDAADNSAIGVLPGFYFNPAKIDFDIRVKGNHNLVVIDFIGGGPDGSAINIHREFPTNYLVTDFTYRAFLAEAGIVAEVGIYTLRIRSYFEGALRSDSTLALTLYDEEYLSRYSAELWDSTNDELLGVIDPDGSSIFKAPVSFDPKSIITDLPHNKVVLSFAKDGESLPEKIHASISVVSDGEYFYFDEITTAYGPGKYDLLAEVFLDDVQVYQRLSSWKIADEIVKPIAGLILGTFPANTINFKEIQALPLNNTEIDLPANWGIKPSDESGVEFDYQSAQLFQKNNGALNEVNISLYTGLPQFINYPEPVTESNFPLFRDLNSTDIGNIHKAPSSFRVVYTKRIGGESGKIVEIDQADFAFRVPLEPEDYSGMRYITDNGGVVTVVDANVPKIGRTYLLSKYPDIWSVSVLEFDGELFDEITSKAKINLGGSDIALHLFGPDYIIKHTLSAPVSVLDEDVSLISGYPDADHLRSCFAPDGSGIIIDQPCEIEITIEGRLAGVLIGTKTSRFALVEEVENPPIKDCCGDGGSAELPVYEGVAGTWGGPFTIPKITFTENGTASNAENIPVKIPGVDVTGSEEDGFVLEFDYAPRVLFPGTDLDNVATIGQLQSAVAAGSADKTPVKTVATSNIVLASLQNINGYSAVGGDRVLVQNQTDARENGPYIVSPGAWTRAADGDTGTELVGASFLVTAGNASVINTKWKVTNTPPIVLGTDNITIIQTQGSEADPTVPAWVKAITEVQPARWDSAYAVAVNFNSLFDARFGSKNTSNLAESPSYLYFTEARVRATPLTGLPAFTNAFINEFDTVLSAFGKIQGQINNTSSNLSNYVRKDIAGLITASHVFTGTDLTLPNNHYRSLSSNVAATNYFPLGGNGAIHSYAALRVYDASTGGTKQLTFGGDGSFQWNGQNVVLENRQVNTGTGLTGGGALSANRTISVVFGTSAGTVSEGNHLHSFASLTGKPTTLAGYGITDAASSTDLSSYVKKDVGQIITADHQFTNPNLALPNALYRNLSSNIAATNYFPQGGNGSNHSFANLRVYDSSTGGTRTLAFGGDGSFTWNGLNITTENYVNGRGFITASSFNNLTNKTGLLSMWTNDVGFVNTDTLAASLNGYVSKTIGGIISADHQFTNPNLALPNALYRALSSNIAATNYFPQGGNGAANSFASLRVYDASTGGTKQLNFGGDGSFQWNSQNIATQNWVTGTALSGYATESYVNSRGFITGINSGNVISALGYTPYNASNPAGYITASSSDNLTNKSGNISMWSNNSGYITGINSGMVTGALGYTPYNSSNPSGYISGINSGMVTSALGYTPTTGPGTSGYLPKYTGSLTFANSIIQDFGSSIQVNGGMQVNGVINLTHGLAANGGILSGGLLWAATDLRIDGTANFYGNVNISGILKPARIKLPSGTEAQMNALPSPQDGEEFYVNTGIGKGKWTYMGSDGWRLMATRLWVGASGAGSSPP